MSVNTYMIAKALIINKHNEALLLIRSDVDSVRPKDTDLPGGGVDVDETIVQAVCREIKEEVGLTVQETNMELIFADTRMDGLGEENLIRHLLVTKKFDGKVVLSEEHSLYEWVPVQMLADRFTHEVWNAAIRYAIKNKLL